MMHEQAHCCDEAANHQLPVTVAFWIIWTVSMEECSSLMQNLMQIHCSTWSFWICDHTAHTLTQWCLPPPPTSTVKSALFMHVHCSPLSLAARVHWCHRDHHYINNGWTFFSGQTSLCIYICMYVSGYIYVSSSPPSLKMYNMCCYYMYLYIS